MMPSSRRSLVADLALVFGVAVALAACVALAGCAACPAPAPASWAEYVERHPYYRDLDPSKDHPGWRGTGGVCGAGKCG